MAAFYICRTCLAEKMSINNMHPLFDGDPYCAETLEKIEACAGFALKQEDGFPQMICDECIRCLDISYKFRIMCQSSESILMETSVCEDKIKKENDIHVKNDSDNIANILFKDVIEVQKIEFDILPVQSDSSDDALSDLSASSSKFHYRDEHIKESTVRVQKNVSLKNLDKTKPSRGRKKKFLNDKIVCEICGNVYEKRHALISHMHVHLDKKSFECEICGKQFARTSQVRRHMRVHTGKKPYVCKFCGRAFSDHSSHTKHERIHTKERPFICNTCGKSFTYSNVLKNHIRTHTGEKPFSCVPCNKFFSRKDQLDQHCATLTHRQTKG